MNLQEVNWILSILTILVGGLAGWSAATSKLGKYIQIIDDLKIGVDKINDKLNQLSIRLAECSTKLDERTQNASSSFTQSKSPISLSEKGELFLKKSGSDKFVLENTKDLVEKIRIKNPKSAYDVQEFAKEVIKDVSNEERFLPFKDFAYKEGLDLENIILIMGIYLRDLALPLLDFKPEDIDKLNS